MSTEAEQVLVNTIRRADALRKQYFRALIRLQKFGTEKARKSKASVEQIQASLTEASALLPDLRKATEEAATLAQQQGRSLQAPMLTAAEPTFGDLDYPELQISDAIEARSQIASLRMLFPMTDWSNILDDEDPKVDLYGSVRKKLWIAGGAIALGVAVLAIVAPQAAAGVAVVTLLLAVPVYIRGVRWGYW